MLYIVSCDDIFANVFRNSFIDQLLELNAKLGSLNYQKLEILRLYGRFHENVDFPDPFDVVRYQSYPVKSKGKDSCCLHKFRTNALHYKIRSRDKEIQADEKKYLHEINNGTLPTALQKKT